MSFDTKFIEFCIVFQWCLNHIKFIFTIVLFFIKKITIYGAQNEAYMSRSAEKWVRGLCFNELGVGG